MLEKKPFLFVIGNADGRIAEQLKDNPGVPERVLVIEVAASDRNRSRHTAPRSTRDGIR
ncbi:hypothetical protein ACIRBX_37780 [Kitasatospora sp. NPDC096147]|uniref:hypothetical protein n=1 Tax=Kitasatospora sp. NPDC096147 TaxID=3364093 RepID=UPI0037F331AE